MKKISEIHIPGGSDIFKHLTRTLLPYHTKAVGSYLFIVEGTLAKTAYWNTLSWLQVKTAYAQKTKQEFSALGEPF